MRLDLGKLMFHIIGIHGPDLILGWGSENLNNLDQLIDATLTREDGLPEHELGHNTAGGPDVDGSSVVGSSEDEFRRAIIARANVRDIRLARHENLCANIEQGRRRNEECRAEEMRNERI